MNKQYVIERAENKTRKQGQDGLYVLSTLKNMMWVI